MVEQTTQQIRVISFQAGPGEVDAGAARYSTAQTAPHTNTNIQSRLAKPHPTNVESGVPKPNSEEEGNHEHEPFYFAMRISCFFSNILKKRIFTISSCRLKIQVKIHISA